MAPVAVLVALLAVLVSAGSLAVAWRALDRAEDAREIALSRAPVTGQNPGQPDVAPTPAEPGPATDPTDPAVGGTELPVNPAARYGIAYQSTNLQVQVQCNNMTYIDLDKPQVKVDSQVADLTMALDCASGAVAQFDPPEAAAVVPDATANQVTPNDCATRIRTGPVADGAKIPVRQGVVMCLLTSSAAADTLGITWKLVVLEVLGVVDESGADTANVRVTAWDVPR